MTDQTQAQLSLLAGAEDDQGNPIHPALRTLCDDGECDATGGFIQWTGEPYAKPGYTDLIKHPDCEGNRYVPNPDPLALIAACDTKGWGFEWHQGVLWLFDRQDQSGVPYLRDGDAIRVGGDDFLAALVSAVFQATETARPANWERCRCAEDIARIEGHGCEPCDAMPIGECNGACVYPCHGTGYILKGETHAR